MRKVFIASILLAILLAPSLAGAAWLPLVPCGATSGPNQVPCTPCSLFQAFKNIIDLVLYGVTGPIAAFMIVYAGGMMLLGGGKPELYSRGKTLLTNTMIGVAIILLSWLVTNFLIKALMTGGQGDSWYEFSCPVGLSVIKPLETALPTGGVLPPLPAGIEMVPENAGVATLGVSSGGPGINPFCPQIFACQAAYYKGCPAWRSVIQDKYPANAALLESIMFHESSCRINPPLSGAGAYGILQMKPSTANLNKNGCDIMTKDAKGNVVPENITQAWLTSEQNLDKILCVANNIVNSLKRDCGSTELGIAAGYNGGPGACAPSRDCASIASCIGDGASMRRWECPWDDKFHEIQNTGYRETRTYAPKVAACAK